MVACAGSISSLRTGREEPLGIAFADEAAFGCFAGGIDESLRHCGCTQSSKARATVAEAMPS